MNVELISGDDSDGGGDWDEERTVCQFHYSAWPDHGIPLQVKPLLEMVRLIRDCQASETLPVLVHCSAGTYMPGPVSGVYLGDKLEDIIDVSVSLTITH